MIKIKALIPSLRENNRYLLYKADKTITEKEVMKGIKDFIGEFGLAQANPVLIIKKQKKGIIKVNRKYINHIKTALMLIKNNNLKTVKVSGMLNRVKGGI